MRLVVFFSRGMSLEGWRKAGMLERELALYRGLQPHLEHLAFLTYGGVEEEVLAAHHSGLVVLHNRWRLPSNLYSVLAPLLHRRVLARATVFRTNQINGAWTAVLAQRLFRRKLVVRCGFLWSDFVARLHPGSWRVPAARWLEQFAVRAADEVVVAADVDRFTIIARYGLPQARVHVIPNYVDTQHFRPMPDVAREPGRVLFVGRLDDQKNVAALMDAMAELPGAHLMVVGDGPLRPTLEGMARHMGVAAEFLGTRPHDELPLLLNTSEVFVLPSHYEGNPKSLIEAMACGMAVIGTRVPGIREILIHGENGYLCGSSAVDIRSAVRDVLADRGLRERLGHGAVAYVRAHCTVESAVARELMLLGNPAPGAAAV